MKNLFFFFKFAGQDDDKDEYIEEEEEEDNHHRGLVPVPTGAVGSVNVPNADMNNNPIIANLPSRNSRYHDGQMEDPFNIKKLVICPMCNGKFAYKEDLFNHMSLYHPLIHHLAHPSHSPHAHTQRYLHTSLSTSSVRKAAMSRLASQIRIRP